MENSGFTIRTASIGDANDIVRMITLLAEYEDMVEDVTLTAEDVIKNVFSDNVAKVLIAKLDGKKIGYALYFYNFSTFLGKKGIYIEDIFIDKPFRGGGFGGQLFDEIVNIAKVENCHRIDFECLKSNISAKVFYDKKGAKMTEIWDNFRLTLK